MFLQATHIQGFRLRLSLRMFCDQVHIVPTCVRDQARLSYLSTGFGASLGFHLARYMARATCSVARHVMLAYMHRQTVHSVHVKLWTEGAESLHSGDLPHCHHSQAP